jgi:hypothetical protein
MGVAGIGVLATVLGALLVLWLTFQHVPAWYQPVQLDAEESRDARADATGMGDWISGKMVDREPFEVVLHDWSITRWLAALPVLWPEFEESVPAGLSEGAVKFDDGRILAGAHYEHQGWRLIINLAITTEIVDGGDHLMLKLETVRGGSLPVPKAVIRELLVPLVARSRRIQSVDDLFDGVKIDNRFTWPNGDRLFRIDSIHIEDGDLRIGIVPL